MKNVKISTGKWAESVNRHERLQIVNKLQGKYFFLINSQMQNNLIIKNIKLKE